jgi:type I restriction enzyme R subunit
MNPKYYDRMSELLDALLEERRKGALDYKAYLAKLLDRAAKLGKGESETKYPEWADNGARRALADFFFPNDNLAIQIDAAIRHSKPDSWVGNAIKEKKVKRAIAAELPQDFDQLDELFDLVKARHEYR